MTTMKGLPDRDEFWSWQQKLAERGPRFAGNAAHRGFVDELQSQLQDIGLTVHRDELYFRRWEATRWELRLHNVDGGEEVLPVAYYYPYSGETSSQGVSGELAYCGKAPGNYLLAAGKIAVVESPIPPFFTFFFRRRSGKLPLVLINPTIGSFLSCPDLIAAAAFGVLGVVCVWRNCSSDNAAGQALPFTRPYQGCPGLWVDGNTGDKLIAQAERRARATLVLEADVTENAPTHTLWAELPGQNPNETVIVNTHTDGANLCEENGGLALLALARYFSAKPVSERQRSLLFAFITGHFRLPELSVATAPLWQATGRWLVQHPDLWDGEEGHRQAVAGVTFEHLGAMEWLDDKTRSRYAPTGQPDYELVYTGNEEMERIYQSASRLQTVGRPVTLRPANELYFGEGAGLYYAGIPTISLVPAPTYLCAAPPGGEIEKVDATLSYQQLQTFARVLEEIDRTPTEQIGPVEPQAFGLLSRVLRWARRRNPST
jgi:hypothetical protein